jgi:hypothetical protein
LATGLRPGTLAIGILRTKFLKNLSRFSAESVNDERNWWYGQE